MKAPLFHQSFCSEKPSEGRRESAGDVTVSAREKLSAFEGWIPMHSWDLTSFIDNEETLERMGNSSETEFQTALGEFLEVGESVIFGLASKEGGGMSFRLGLRSSNRNRGRSLGVALRSLEHCLTFEEGETFADSAEDRWRELLPSTEGLPAKSIELGFDRGELPNQENGTIEVPAVRWEIRPDRLAYLLVECDELDAVEVSLKALPESDEWDSIERSVQGAMKHWGNAPQANRLTNWIGKTATGRRFEIRCRVAFNDESHPEAWADMLGREVFRSKAVFARGGVNCEAGKVCRTFGEDDLPLLIPTVELLRESRFRSRYHARIPRLPMEGCIVGKVEGRVLKLPDSGRQRHTYIVGATGTGKSTLLHQLIRQDLENGEGVIVLDPHGDLCESVRQVVPADRADSVIVIDPSGEGSVPGFNPLAISDDRFRDIRCSFVIGEFLNLFHQLWDVPEAFGPMFDLYFRNAMALLMRSNSEKPASLADFQRVFTDAAYRTRLIRDCELLSVKMFWRKMAEAADGEAKLENIAPYIASKMDCLTSGGFVSQVVSRVDTTLRLEEVMSRKKILLVNLNKGLIGSRESRLLGMLLMTQIFSAAMGRSLQPESERTPCHLYVDEFQNFVSAGMADMLSESRKFGLQLTLANQTLQQLSDQRGNNGLLDSVLGNVGNLIAFRLGVRESEVLAPFTHPFTPKQMQRMPNFHAFARVLDAEGPIDPVVMKTIDR